MARTSAGVGWVGVWRRCSSRQVAFDGGTTHCGEGSSATKAPIQPLGGCTRRKVSDIRRRVELGGSAAERETAEAAANAVRKGGVQHVRLFVWGAHHAASCIRATAERIRVGGRRAEVGQATEPIDDRDAKRQQQPYPALHDNGVDQEPVGNACSFRAISGSRKSRPFLAMRPRAFALPLPRIRLARV